jgi:hypothetical protein
VQRAQDELVGVEGREHDHSRRAGLSAEQARRRDAVEVRNADVHQDDVGVVPVDPGEKTPAVLALADDLPNPRGELAGASPGLERVE